MAHENEEIVISKGPSKLDLMLSLFDTDMGERIVKFYQKCDESGIGGYYIYDVQIISMRRRNPAATTWEIEGITDAKGGKTRVSIYYLSDTREGTMRFEDEFRTHGVMEMPDDIKRAKALMIVIHQIIAKYQNRHRGNLDEEIFVLFEKAKRVKFANDRESLAEAIKNI